MSAPFPGALAWALALLTCGCLSPWSMEGPYACASDGTCPSGFTCDDGLCCKPDGVPACPTRPNSQGLCAGGSTPSDVYEDKDGDGYGNPNVVRRVCRIPELGHWVSAGTDCDDANPQIHPGADEACNGRDDNCNGHIDEGLLGLKAFYKDDDGDGYGDTAQAMQACAAPPGTVDVPGDCAPFDPARHPGAAELCNRLDDNCNGTTDEEPLADVQSSTDTVLRWPCDTGQKGVCAAGRYGCDDAVPAPASPRVCQRLTAPSAETCNGLDDDCNGRVDEQPGCGGPPSLLSAAGVKYGALKLPSGSTLTKQCQKNTAGATAETAGAGSWSGTGSGYHLWYAEAPPGGWDLSRANLELHLSWTDTFTPVTAPATAFGDPSAGSPFNPVVYLCGDADTDLIRYRIVAAADAFKQNDAAFTSTLPLNASTSTWLVGVGSGFDTSRVRRIELVVYSYASFTVTFGNGTGFVP